MSPAPQNPEHPIKRIELPSGRTMDVLSFADAAAETTRPQPRKARALHRCESCSSELVYPIDWAQEGERWRVTLRCPECEHVDNGSFDQGSVDVFDECLEEGTQELLKTLRELSQANMQDYVERFLGALEADAILPEDFTTSRG